jgi:EDD domain protein, DegV family
MGTACIVTDSSAQFTFPGFPGKKCLKVLNHEFRYISSDGTVLDNKKVGDLPAYTGELFQPKIVAATPETISATLAEILPFYDDIFVILLSKEISSLYQETEKIVHTLHGHADLHLIDSQNTSLGLGLLVQYAAEAITRGEPVDEIEKKLRLVIPHIYTVLCTPNLSYLRSAGVLDIGQATVGEMLSLYSLFVLEDGKLNPLQKVKNQHAAIDYFIEFVDEFDDLSNLAFIQPAAPVISESKLLHQHLDEMFPHTTYTEHLINPFLFTMFGPRAFGMVVMENTEKML